MNCYLQDTNQHDFTSYLASREEKALAIAAAPSSSATKKPCDFEVLRQLQRRVEKLEGMEERIIRRVDERFPSLEKKLDLVLGILKKRPKPIGGISINSSFDDSLGLPGLNALTNPTTTALAKPNNNHFNQRSNNNRLIQPDNNCLCQSNNNRFSQTNNNNRLTNSSSSLIDLAISNSEHIKECKVVDLGMSDHSLIYLGRDRVKIDRPHKTITSRPYKNFDEETQVSYRTSKMYGSVRIPSTRILRCSFLF